MLALIPILIAATQPDPLFTHTGAAAGAIVVRADTDALRQAATPILVDAFPLPGRAPVNLVLERFNPIAPNATFVLGTDHGDAPIDVDTSHFLFLRGHAPDHPGSHVFLSLGADTTTGRIELGPGSPAYAVSRADPARDDELTVFESRTIGGSYVPTLCALDDRSGGDPAPAGLEPVHSMRQAELSIDGDYELFSLFGSARETIDYIVQVYAQVSDISMRDVRVRFDLVFVRVWTTPDDPWGDGVGFPPPPPPEIPHDVRQLLSGYKYAGAGGVAVLCAPASWVAYALGFFTDPTTPNVYNQDIHIAAHELGHNIGSFHTQDYDLDNCHIANNPPQRGSIMSYCSQSNTGGSAVTDLRFHTVPQAAILDCLDAKPNFVFDCNQNAIDDALDIADGTSQDLNANGVPDECEDCNANGILDPEDIVSGFSADANANGIPDECEPDCNANGFPDDLDILMGTSTDAYGNGVPDECEADCNANGISDYTEIQLDMTLDIDRNAVLDACQDCDADGIPDIVSLNGANNAWAISAEDGVIKEYHAVTGVLMRESEPGHLNDARDLLITPDARILVTSAADDRVAEFDRTGAFVRDFVPSGAGGLDEPGAMLLHDGALLVASTASNNVLRFDAADGSFLGVFATAGAGGLDEPYGLALGPNANVLVTSDDDRVLEFDARTGAFVRAFVDRDDNGGLLRPRGIAIVPDGRVVVASQFTNTLLAFHPDTGAFLGQYHNGEYADPLEEPWGLRVGPDGHVHAGISADHEFAGGHDLHLTNPRIFKFDGANGNLLFAYVQSLHAELNGARGFDFMPSDGDCNRNLIPDACDIASGTSDDANGNGVPDECEDLCYPDFNDDGALNILDFVAFQLAWQANDPAADCNDDDAFNLLDFVCFQGLFQAGCE